MPFRRIRMKRSRERKKKKKKRKTMRHMRGIHPMSGIHFLGGVDPSSPVRDHRPAWFNVLCCHACAHGKHDRHGSGRRGERASFHLDRELIYLPALPCPTPPTYLPTLWVMIYRPWYRTHLTQHLVYMWEPDAVSTALGIV